MHVPTSRKRVGVILVPATTAAEFFTLTSLHSTDYYDAVAAGCPIRTWSVAIAKQFIVFVHISDVKRNFIV